MYVCVCVSVCSFLCMRKHESHVTFFACSQTLSQEKLIKYWAQVKHLDNSSGALGTTEYTCNALFSLSLLISYNLIKGLKC